MSLDRDVDRLMRLYPRIFFACHTRHVPDPGGRRVVSAHQARLLDHLDDVHPTSLTELARHMGVTPSTMSITVERLVRQGYVLRSRDSHDARRTQLFVSAAGLRIKDAHSVLDRHRVKAMLARLAAPGRERALAGLAALADAAGSEMAALSAAGRFRGQPAQSGVGAAPRERRKHA